MFGPENYGLTNEELHLCDMLITIPTSPEYSSLNLSHAVSILCYSAFNNTQEKQYLHQPASFEIKEQLKISFSEYIDKFYDKNKQSIPISTFHNIIGRSRITEGEARNLIGAFKAWKFHVDQLEKNNNNK